MKRQGKSQHRGFTLVEMLITTAIVVFVVVVLSQILSATQGIWRNSESRTDPFRDARAAVELMARELALATPNDKAPVLALENICPPQPGDTTARLIISRSTPFCPPETSIRIILRSTKAIYVLLGSIALGITGSMHTFCGDTFSPAMLHSLGCKPRACRQIPQPPLTSTLLQLQRWHRHRMKMSQRMFGTLK